MKDAAMLTATLIALACVPLHGRAVAAEPDFSPLAAKPPDGGHLLASGLADEIKFCVGPTDVNIRLGCFEDLAVRLGLQVLPVTGVLKHAGSSGNFSWTNTGGTSPDGSPAAAAAIQSSDVVSSDSVFANEPATLFLRCSSHQTSLYVSFRKPITPKQTSVALSLDGGKQAAYTWTPSVAGTALGLWAPEDATPLAKYIAGGTRLTVKIKLPESRDVTVAFDVAGMADAMGPVRAACGW
jgi:hypothetical protein